MIKRWLIYLPVLAGCAIIAALFEQWTAQVLLQFLLLLPLFSLAVSLPAMLTVRLSFDCPQYLTVGDQQSVQMALKCRLPAPPVRCRMRVSHSLTGRTLRLKQGQPLPAEHCGQLVCTPERAVCFDYLGFFPFPVLRKEGATICVRPLPQTMTLPADMDSRICRSWHPKPGGGFSETYELRLYRPGDSLNQIHWKLSAKVGKPIIREAMIPRQRTAALVMTLQGEPDVLDRKLGRLLWAGNWLLEQNIPIEIRAFTANGLLCLPVQDGQQLLLQLDTLMAQPPFIGDASNHRISGSWQLYVGGEPDGE